MGMIQDLAQAIDAYPSENVVLTVTDFGEPGGHINDGELCTFNVRVENNGHLDMNNLRLHIEASEWASVGLYPWSLSNDYIASGPKDVKAGSTRTMGLFWMKALKATPDQGKATRDLFTVHISRYDASLHHILKDHDHHAPTPEEAYSRHIHPE